MWRIKRKQEGKHGFRQSTPSSNKHPRGSQHLPHPRPPCGLGASFASWVFYSKPPSSRWLFQAHLLESCPVSPSQLPLLSCSTGRQRLRARAGNMPLSLAGSSTWSTGRQMPSAAAAGAAAWSHWRRRDLQLCLPLRGPWYIGLYLAGPGWGTACLSKADVGQAWSPQGHGF